LVDLVEPGPALGRGWVRARGEAGRVPVSQAVRIVAASACEPEGSEQEGAGEPLKAVAPRPGAAGRPGNAEQRVAWARIRPHGKEQLVRRRLPVGPRPPGIGRQL